MAYAALYILKLGYGSFRHTKIKQSFCSTCVLLTLLLSCLCHSYCTVADLCVSLCVLRAIFAYDGVTNKLKLADSGGKMDCNKWRVCNAHFVFLSPAKNDTDRILTVSLKGIHLTSCVKRTFLQLLSKNGSCHCICSLISNSGWCGRTGRQISHLQASIRTVQSGKCGDRRPPDCYDQLGEWQAGSWGLALVSTSLSR